MCVNLTLLRRCDRTPLRRRFGIQTYSQGVWKTREFLDLELQYSYNFKVLFKKKLFHANWGIYSHERKKNVGYVYVRRKGKFGKQVDAPTKSRTDKIVRTKNSCFVAA